MLKCEECGSRLKNFVALSQHVTKIHKISTEEYYLRYNVRPHCPLCGSLTKFVNMNVGYRETCSNKCASNLQKQRLKNNPEKFQQFSEKVSENMKKIWSTRDKSAFMAEGIEKRKENISRLTKEERRLLFGKNKKGNIKSLVDYWENASEDQKRETREKQANTHINLPEERKLEIIAKQKQTFLKNCVSFGSAKQIEEENEWYSTNSERILGLFE